MGLLGFKGLSGIKGDPSDLWALAWFAWFSYFWWSKLGKFEDERLVANKYKAGAISFRLCITIAFILSLSSYLYCEYSSNFEQLYRVQILILTLTFAVATNLWAFLTYRFDVKG